MFKIESVVYLNDHNFHTQLLKVAVHKNLISCTIFPHFLGDRIKQNVWLQAMKMMYMSVTVVQAPVFIDKKAKPTFTTSYWHLLIWQAMIIILVKTVPLCIGMAWLPFQKGDLWISLSANEINMPILQIV